MPCWYFHKRPSLLKSVPTTYSRIKIAFDTLSSYLFFSYEAISFVLISVMVACLHSYMITLLREFPKNMLTLQLVLHFKGVGV